MFVVLGLILSVCHERDLDVGINATYHANGVSAFKTRNTKYSNSLSLFKLPRGKAVIAEALLPLRVCDYLPYFVVGWVRG